MLAFGDKRQHAGNLGYKDDPTSSYEYDSFVANCRQVREGDVAVVRDHSSLIGVARIESIIEQAGTKQQRRCPACGNVGIKERRTVSPRFRCYQPDCGTEFDEPKIESASCTNFRALYGSSFVASGAPVNMGVLKAACPRYNEQHSIIEIDLPAVWSYLFSALDGVPPFVMSDLPGSPILNPEPDEIVQAADGKKRESRLISIRQGQGAFRKQLIVRYGARCAISGSVVEDALHAAHISPYMGSHSNTVENGLLLRADLHQLHDRFLLAFHPETLMLHIHPKLGETEYASYAGTKLQLPEGVRISTASLRAQWLGFVRAAGESLDAFPA